MVDLKAEPTSPAVPSRWSRPVQPLLDILTWLEKHRMAATLIPFVFVAAKVMVVSRGDVPTALGILQTAGIVSVVLGGLLCGIPLLAAVLLAYFAFEAFSLHTWQSFGYAGGALVVCFFITPWPAMVGTGVATAIAIARGMARGRSSGSPLIPPQADPSRRRSKAVVALGGLLVGALTFSTWTLLYAVWLPHEQITTKSQTYVGYVLSDDSQWVSILRSGSRLIIRIRDTAVVNREVCERSTGLWLYAPKSLFQRSWPRDLGPPCHARGPAKTLRP